MMGLDKCSVLIDFFGPYQYSIVYTYPEDSNVTVDEMKMA